MTGTEFLFLIGFQNYVKMSKKQLKHFFKLATNENSTPGQNLINNYRPVQILHNRTIFYADLKLDCDTARPRISRPQIARTSI